MTGHTSYWTFSLPLPAEFSSCAEPDGVHWHEGPFQWGDQGLTARGAPPGLEEAALKISEVQDIHALMRDEPNDFFHTTDICWIYTGKTGEAPDAIGSDRTGGVYLGEIKWKEGWAASLPTQLGRYAHLAVGDLCDRKLHLRVAAAQAGADVLQEGWRSLGSDLQRDHGWSNVHIALGFLQLGWAAAGDVYLRIEWKELP